MTTSIDDFEEDYDEYDGFDDEDGERGVSGFVVILIILAMLSAFFFTVLIAYKSGIRQGSNGDVPFVAADPTPAKTIVSSNDANKPESREVYNQLEGSNAATTEVLGSGSEKPILSGDDRIASLAAEAQEAVSDQAQNVRNAGNNAVNSVNAAADDARNTLNQVAQQGRNVTGAAAGTITGDATDYGREQSERLTNVIADAVSESTPATERLGSIGANRPTNVAATSGNVEQPTRLTPARSSASISAINGSHVVQVGAFRSEAEADTYWTRLQNRFGSFLDGKVKDVERADLGDRGVYYRLRIASFNSSDAAKSYCTSLKSRNQDCLVKSL